MTTTAKKKLYQVTVRTPQNEAFVFTVSAKDHLKARDEAILLAIRDLPQGFKVVSVEAPDNRTSDAKNLS
jgi:hypothetical protein